MSRLLPIILCGGSGTRLWPLSSRDRPKQFLSLVDEKSLLQNTALRLLNVTQAGASEIISVTSKTLYSSVREHLTSISPEFSNHIICEPECRNTSPAIFLALRYVLDQWRDDPLLLICPSDAYIGDEDVFAQALSNGVRAAREGKIVIYGITPDRAETGYGYIRQGEAYSNNAFYVDRFTEKPCLEDAQDFLLSGDYLWNSGIFLIKASTLLEEYQAYAPEFIAAPCFEEMPSLPFDKAILEKSDNIVVIPMNPDWSDLGSWESIWQISAKDDDGNAVSGNVVLTECMNCLIKAGNGKTLALSGLEDTVVVETENLIYIGNINDSYAPARLLKKMN